MRALALTAVIGMSLINSFVSQSSLAAQGLNANEIMGKNFFVSKLRSVKSDSTMILVNEKGQTRERKNTTLVKLQKNGVDSKVLVKFSAPADIKGTGFLQVEHAEGDDELWIYLPALKKARRLVANNKKDSFVGSDFSYGDVLLPKIESYLHTLLRVETVGNEDCYVIESVPKNDSVRSDSGYSKKINWVRKDNFLETKVEYYDLSGRLLKTQLVTEHKLLEADTRRWFALHREMINHQTGHKTTMNFDKVEAGVVAPDELFSLRYIERE